MSNLNLGKDVLFTTALDLASAASADRNGAVIDMQGFEGVLMCIKFGDIAGGAVTSIKAQQDTALAFNVDAQDLLGTGQTVADSDDNQIFIIDLVKPLERFVRMVVDKDTSNNTQEMAWYIQYAPGKRPQSNNVTDLVTYELHVSPAEGTA